MTSDVGRGRTWLVWTLLLVGVGYLAHRWSGRTDQGPETPTPDEAVAHHRKADALVEIASEDSFPASDAPSYWARESDDL